MIRPFVLLFVVVALALTLGSGTHAYTGGTGMDATVVAAHGDASDCAKATTLQGEAGKHDAGGNSMMGCCPGAICTFAGLPATSPLVATAATTTALPSVTTAALTGRDVSPPLDPPRSFA